MSPFPSKYLLRSFAFGVAFIVQNVSPDLSAPLLSAAWV